MWQNTLDSSFGTPRINVRSLQPVDQGSEPKQVVRSKARTAGRDHLEWIEGRETRPRPGHCANVTVSGLVPDPIAMTVVPLVHHDNLLTVERMKGMRDTDSAHRTFGAGCIR